MVYTRSQSHLAQSALTQQGAIVDHVPLMDTRAKALSANDWDFLLSADAWVFTSEASVRHLYAQKQSIDDGKTRLYVAIGQTTARALSSQTSSTILIAKAPYNSEALLSHWQPKNQRIAIIAAEGGRELLQSALALHNHVRPIYAYERFNPTLNYPTHFPIPHAMMLASLQTVHHLVRITPQSYLKLLKLRCTMVAISHRVSQSLVEQGFLHTLAAPVAEEASQIQLMSEWWQQRQEYQQ